MGLRFSLTLFKRTLLKDAESRGVLIQLIFILAKLQNLFLIIMLQWLQITMPKLLLQLKPGKLLQWQWGKQINQLIWTLKISTFLKKQNREETMTLMSLKILRPERACITPCKDLTAKQIWAQEQTSEPLTIEKWRLTIMF